MGAPLICLGLSNAQLGPRSAEPAQLAPPFGEDYVTGRAGGKRWKQHGGAIPAATGNVTRLARTVPMRIEPVPNGRPHRPDFLRAGAPLRSRERAGIALSS